MCDLLVLQLASGALVLLSGVILKVIAKRGTQPIGTGPGVEERLQHK
jgi:hypothetical protein